VPNLNFPNLILRYSSNATDTISALFVPGFIQMQGDAIVIDAMVTPMK